MAAYPTTIDAQVGDWLEVAGPPGSPVRRGQVREVLGAPGHVHFRVRWDEEHESLFYPEQGVAVVHRGGREREHRP
jgi:hypothetical protein